MTEIDKLTEQIAKEAIQKRIKMPLDKVSTKYETMYITSALLACIEVGEAIITSAMEEWQESNRWRKVEEELPEMGEKVLCMLRNEPDSLFVGFISPNTHRWFVCGDVNEGVTHWKQIE